MATDLIVPNVQGTEQQTLGSTIKFSVIPAGGLYTITEYGERFYFVKCSSPVLVKNEHGTEKPYTKGQGEHYRDPKMWFKRLEIRNPNTYDVYVAVWVGFGAFLDTTSELIETPARFYAYNATSIPATTNVVFTGNPSGVQLLRKSIQVSNMDLANSLLFMECDSTGTPVRPGLAIFPGQSSIMHVAGAIAVRNPTSSSITCYISENWYVFA